VILSSLDLNLLLVLDTVLSERSVARAAKRLHVTPSAISNGLAKLRVALNDPLVTREGRGIVPTPRATELRPGLARAIAELERVVTQGAFDPLACSRTFTLAMADGGQVAWLPKIAAALVKAMPNAQLRVVGIESLMALGDLGSGEIDLHLGVPAKGPGIHVEALLEERTLLVARSGGAATKSKLTRARFAALRHVAVEMAPGRGFRDPVTAAYSRAGLERHIVVTVSTFGAAAAVATASDLVATLPVSFFAAQRGRGGLAKVAGPVPNHAVPIALCWHERTHTDPAMLALRALVRDVLGLPPP
jgi:DNA-binding transcriptional LysR family regulator